MTATVDPVTLEVLRNQLESIAEEMGQTLIQSAFSPNIKERQDCSTALFDATGRMIAQAEHIPVHLGAMPEAVQAVREREPSLGDVFALNDPFAGGTHLPDLTLVSPLTHEQTILGYAVSRAHHADVGGQTPGSMPAGAREIYQEGFRIPPVKLVADGTLVEDTMALVLANVRNREERQADLQAQLAANKRANRRIDDLIADHGLEQVQAGFDAVMEYSNERMTTEIATLPNGTYHAEDVLEGDGITDADIPITATVTIEDTELTIDFTGTADQVAGNLNAPLSVAKSAAYFVIRCVTDPEIPPNHGCYAPITVHAPEGSLLHPTPPTAVVGGNVETSQRVTDVLFTALGKAIPEQIPAQGQGTMNNVTIGARDGSFTYYETIAGGAGARPTADGMDGVHVGMTNTLNTPVEAIEAEYPIRVDRYALRPDSGGDGQYRGGLGIERTMTVHTDATVSLVTERRRQAPAGKCGGNDGACGANRIDDKRVPAKTTVDITPGTTVTVRTPGGGGYGPPEDRTATDRKADRDNEKVTET